MILMLMRMHLVKDMLVIVGIFEGLFGEPEVRQAFQALERVVVIVLMH